MRAPRRADSGRPAARWRCCAVRRRSIGAGFALILLTGHIDSEGKRLVLDALHRTYYYYAGMKPREPAVMIRDLESFPASDCVKP